MNDVITAEIGLWLTGTHKLDFGTLDWNATLTKPTFGEDFDEDEGYNITFRSSVMTDSGFGLGAGVFKSTADPTCTTATTCSLAGGFTRGGGPLQGDGDPYSFAGSAPGARNKHVGLAPGLDAVAWQIDALYSGDHLGLPVTLHGFFGQVEDDFSFAAGDLATDAGAGVFSKTDAEYDFWGAFGMVKITKDFYLASRYTATSNEADGISSDENITRIQGGAGYWFTDRVLLKAEYVYQNEEANSGGGVCAFGVSDCDWDSFNLELSVSL